MKTAVKRWGNSLALRIPKAYAAETHIRNGSEVEVSLKSGALVVRPIRRKRRVLSDLLKQITPSNRHAAVPTGQPAGHEVW
jgi:antitoxin MazE